MTSQLAIVLALLAASIAMFVMNRPRMDAVGLIMLTLLPLTGIITASEALAGFSDANIVLLAALFVIGEALVRTGVAQSIGDWLIRTAGSSSTRLLVLLMAAVSGLGAFMSSTGVVAIFIPITLRIAQNTGTAPSRLMMPLSVAALISGMMTLVATAPNLVVNSELVRQGFAGFGFFSFTPFGLPVLVLGIAYMLFARRWLAVSGGTGGPERPSMTDWIERYDLAGREHRLRVTSRSPLLGKTPRRDRSAHRHRGASHRHRTEARLRHRRHRPTKKTRSRTGTSSWSTCPRRRWTSRRCSESMGWNRSRSAAPTSATGRRTSAWRR